MGSHKPNYIMVTRPAHQAGPLIKCIEDAGAKVFYFPTLSIQAAELDATAKQVLLDIAQYDIAIFISPNAVEHGLDQITLYSSLPEHLQLATVGKGSAHALETKLGRSVDIVPEQEFNSEGLLACPALQNVDQKHIVIFRGNGGREHLANTLRERGAKVDYVCVYNRMLPENDNSPLIQHLQQHDLGAIVIHSGDSLRNLVKLVADEQQALLKKIPLVVINQRIADIARQAGFNNPVLLSHSPDDESIVAVLRKHDLIG